MKRFLIIIIVTHVFLACKNKKELNVNSYSEELLSCNLDTLKNWSESIKKKKKSIYLFPEKVFTEFNEDSTFISVTWRYNKQSVPKKKDELIEYCLELVEEKIKLPKNFAIKFDYIISSSCPSESELPLETYSEIEGLSIYDKEKFTQYDFDVIRGRVDAAVKYFKDKQGKDIDTLYLNYRD